LEPLQDEVLNIIGGLVMTRGMVKQIMQDYEDNLVTLLTQAVKEILDMEDNAKTEVAIAIERLQKIMESRKGVT
jgi:vacuolar-type H+-ATPase subunit E/Vma4